MQDQRFIKLLENALPLDLSLRELEKDTPEEININKREDALRKALLKSPRINWLAYKNNYPDLKGLDIDVRIHFLENGIYEGRKLKSHNLCKLAYKYEEQIKISIIIPNYNNAPFLQKCLNSAVNQTLKEIEIIFIDDNSLDDSLKIAKEFARLDKRIHIITFNETKSQHMARKIGVREAKGEFIMFLDSDDFFSMDACEEAYNHIIKGYDIVYFNTTIINNGNLDQNSVRDFENHLNQVESGEYLKNKILDLTFVHSSMNHNLWNKIFVAGIVKKAFEATIDGYYPRAQDIYEYLHIVMSSRNLYKIDKYLYNYNFGTGISYKETLKKMPHLLQTPGDMYLEIDKFCNANKLRLINNVLKNKFIDTSLNHWLGNINEDNVTQYYNILYSQYGKIFTIKRIMEKFFNDWEKVAKSYLYYSYGAQRKSGDIKKIGIFFHRLSFGGVETIIAMQTKLLLKCGYEIVLFLEQKNEYDKLINKEIKIYYVGMSKYGGREAEIHVTDFYHALEDSKIDILFYHSALSQFLLWDTMSAHSLNIPVFVFLHSCFTRGFVSPKTAYNVDKILKVFSCVDKVICLSSQTKQFLRIHGIDAEYMPNSQELNLDNADRATFNQNIAVVGRMGEPVKQIHECLEILTLVKKHCPQVKMYFIGNFDNQQQLNNFYKQVSQKDLKENVIYTGWSRHPATLMKKCSILLSTSISEGFGMNILEAQSLGMPCVIYKLPLAQTMNNPSIIRVEQYDREEAANKILEILKSTHLWNMLSDIARRKSYRFNPTRYARKLLNLLNSFTKFSSWQKSSEEDIIEILNTISWYTARSIKREEM